MVGRPRGTDPAKEKQRIRSHEWYENNKKNDPKQKLAAGLCEDGCVYCGIKRTRSVYDFHHIDDKDKVFSLIITEIRKHTLSEVVTELLKCCVLCANCHREVSDGVIPAERVNPFQLTLEEICQKYNVVSAMKI